MTMTGELAPYRQLTNSTISILIDTRFFYSPYLVDNTNWKGDADEICRAYDFYQMSYGKLKIISDGWYIDPDPHWWEVKGLCYLYAIPIIRINKSPPCKSIDVGGR